MLPIRPIMAAMAVCLLATAALAQTVTIVSGNGQVTCPNCTTNPIHAFEPLVVVVRDAAGNPVPNATVTWTVTTPPGQFDASQGSVLNTTTITDANGQTQNTFFQGAPLGLTINAYVQSHVIASALGASAVFTETTARSEPTTGVNLVLSPLLISPIPGSSISGRTGETADTPLQVQVNTIFGIGVPGVEVRIIPTDPSNPSTVTCAPQAGVPPGTALTDTSGVATCNLLFGGRPGTGSFTVKIGGNFGEKTSAFNYTVTAGVPRTVRVVSGDQQSAPVGTNLPSPLLAVVEDAGGNPLPDVPVTWQVVSGGATLFNTRQISDFTGRVSTNVTIGSTPGPVQIRVNATNNPAAVATFTANAILTVSSLTKLTGDNQSAAVNTRFSEPLVVQVANQGVPQANIPVSFAVTSGSATLSSSTVSTDSQGRASVSVTAGPTIGPIVVTATAGTFSQTFALTARAAGPQLNLLSLYSGASTQIRGENALSPCAVAQLRAPGLAPGIQGTVTPDSLIGPLPLLLAGVSIQFGNLFAPVYNVSNLSGTEIVTFQVPCDAPVGANQMTVRVGEGSATITVPVQPVSPGLFETTMSDNRRRAVVLRPDGTFASLENPARRGEIVRMYVTGVGPTSPPLGSNQPGIPNVVATLVNPVVVGVNNAGVRVVSVTNAQNLIGVYEVAFEIPNDTPAGPNIPLAIAVQQDSRLVFGNGSAIPIQ